MNPRARKREQTGGVRPVNEGIREERQVCDAGEDRADGEQDTERLPEGKITDRWKNTANRIKDGRIQKSLGIPKSAQTSLRRSQRSESGIPVRKRFSGFLRSRSWTGRKQRTAQGTMEKNSRKYRMTRDQNGLFILNNLLSFLYDPL